MASKQRQQALDILGNCCTICGYTGTALQIDHVQGGGCQEIKKLGRENMYKAIVSGSWQGRYQLLCANCNWEKRYLREEHRPRTRKPKPKRILKIDIAKARIIAYLETHGTATTAELLAAVMNPTTKLASLPGRPLCKSG